MAAVAKVVNRNATIKSCELAAGKGRKGATIDRRKLATVAARIVLGCTAVLCWTAPLVPAVWVNLDAARSQGNTWAVFAIASVVFGAVCVENAIECRGVVKRTLFVFLATFFLCLNVFNALGNAAAHSEDSRDLRSSQIRAFAAIEQQRSQWSQARKAQAGVAGDATPESVEAEIQADKAKDASRWQSTANCNPEKITAGPSRAFCSNLAQLAAKKAAALRRDELDGKIVELDAKLGAGAPPESADPFAANVARMLDLLGYTITDDGKVLIASLRDWGKAAGVELLAGFGPSALLLILWRITGPRQSAPLLGRKAPAPAKEKSPPSLPEPETAPRQLATAALDGDAEIAAFITRYLEFCPGEHIAAGQLFQMWKQECSEHGRGAGSQKSFAARVKRRVQHERNSGRPRYIGVRCKTADAPRLRVVSP
jgi:hypothetical protein